MAPLLLNFSSPILEIIIGTSIILAVLSIGICLCILLRKFWRNFRLRKSAGRRIVLSKLIYVHLENPSFPLEPTYQQLKKGDAPILFDIILSILRTTHGRIDQHLLSIMQAFKIDAFAYQLLKKDHRGKKIQALSLLSHFNTPHITKLLLRHLNSRDKYIQLTALYGLATRGSNECLPKIVDILCNSHRANILMLTDALVKFGEPATPYLIDLAQDAQAPKEVRIIAIKALSKIGFIQAVEPLIGLANAADLDFRAQSLLALSKLGDIRAAPVVLQRLQDPESVVRLQAAHAAGSLKLYAAMPMLIKLLEDDYWWTRYRAAESLYFLESRGIAALNTIALQGGRAGEMAQQLLAEKETHYA